MIVISNFMATGDLDISYVLHACLRNAVCILESRTVLIVLPS